MSYNPKQVRKLRHDERQLVVDLAHGKIHSDTVLRDLDDVLVTDQDDGRMGSVRIAETPSKPDSKIQAFARGLYRDTDGVLISVQVNVSSDWKFYEIDIWKTDFTATRTYPAEARRIE